VRSTALSSGRLRLSWENSTCPVCSVAEASPPRMPLPRASMIFSKYSAAPSSSPSWAWSPASPSESLSAAAFFPLALLFWALLDSVFAPAVSF
jgi:hypothetical protein